MISNMKNMSIIVEKIEYASYYKGSGSKAISTGTNRLFNIAKIIIRISHFSIHLFLYEMINFYKKTIILCYTLIFSFNSVIPS